MTATSYTIEPYHDRRREGHGEHTAPVQRIGGMCAVEGCPEPAQPAARATNSRQHVRYCYRHALEARELFG